MEHGDVLAPHSYKYKKPSNKTPNINLYITNGITPILSNSLINKCMLISATIAETLKPNI